MEVQFPGSLIRRLGPLLVFLAASPAALAVPSFARQTGMACEACHTVYPELSHFGRVFKANGYVLDNLKQVKDVSAKKEELLALAQTPPISIMAQVSYTQLKDPLPDLHPVGVKNLAQNGTVAFPQQFSIFYAGKIAPHFGAFFQLTYSNNSGSIAMDNTDLRFADMMILPSKQSLIYGISLNNNPTIQDLWNSTPAFGYPYTSSNAVVSSNAGAQINGALAGQVAGLTAYAMWNESVYAEIGAYRSAKQGKTNSITGMAGPLDGTASNVIKGISPYWRLAYEKNWQRHSIEVGGYGAQFRLLPGGSAQTPVPLSGPTNRFRDVAVDFQYQYIADQHIVSVAGTRVRETMNLEASYAGGAGSVAHQGNDLTTSRVWATYYFRRKYGATVGFFQTTGSTDTGLYAGPAGPADPGVITSASNSPDTRGWTIEGNYVPWLNTKITLQYTGYSKFNGGSSNYDGVGRNASSNNTLYALLWIAY